MGVFRSTQWWITRATPPKTKHKSKSSGRTRRKRTPCSACRIFGFCIVAIIVILLAFRSTTPNETLAMEIKFVRKRPKIQSHRSRTLVILQHYITACLGLQVQSQNLYVSTNLPRFFWGYQRQSATSSCAPRIGPVWIYFCGESISFRRFESGYRPEKNEIVLRTMKSEQVRMISSLRSGKSSSTSCRSADSS